MSEAHTLFLVWHFGSRFQTTPRSTKAFPRGIWAQGASGHRGHLLLLGARTRTVRTVSLGGLRQSLPPGAYLNYLGLGTLAHSWHSFGPTPCDINIIDPSSPPTGFATNLQAQCSASPSPHLTYLQCFRSTTNLPRCFGTYLAPTPSPELQVLRPPPPPPPPTTLGSSRTPVSC